MNDTPWARYVRRISGGVGGSEIEKKTGIHQSNISRWLNDGTTPQPAQAAKFAQSYDANVLEAFVAAGFLTEEEAGMPPRPDTDFYTIVEEDNGLTEQAKIHLKNQYGLLRAASANARTAQVRSLIEAEDGIDEATKARLLASFEDDGVTTIYSSSATIVEHPFPEGSFRRSTKTRRAEDVDIATGIEDPAAGGGAHLKAAARTMKSAGRAARAAQDEAGEGSQDDA